MKNIIRKIKDWLIDKLGGYTDIEILAMLDASCEVHMSLLEPWRKTVQEICRRSGNSYYDWCCEYCGLTCDKHDGWCERFSPFVAAKSEVIGCDSSAEF